MFFTCMPTRGVSLGPASTMSTLAFGSCFVKSLANVAPTGPLPTIKTSAFTVSSFFIDTLVMFTSLYAHIGADAADWSAYFAETNCLSKLVPHHHQQRTQYRRHNLHHRKLRIRQLVRFLQAHQDGPVEPSMRDVQRDLDAAPLGPSRLNQEF